MTAPFRRTTLLIAALVAAGTIGGCMNRTKEPATPRDAVVRYQVKDVDRSLAFYTKQLGFALEQRAGAAFASVTRGSLRLLLSGPGSSGSRVLPDGRSQEPGGWNRFVLFVDDLESDIRALRAAGIRFRNEVEAGPGGTQIQIEDPDGNPIELHQEPATGELTRLNPR